MGVATGCGYKEVYRFPHTIYLSLLLLYLFFFTAASLLFVQFFVFRSCCSTFCNYILCIKYFFAQYKLTYGQLRATHGSHMKAAHVLYMKKHTQTYASYPATDISYMTSRSVV